jgi:elongation factor P
VFRIEDLICKVLEAEFKAGAAKLGGLVKAKLRNLVSGHIWEPHFRPDERLDDVELQQRSMECLFAAGDNFTFMDPENFEQVEFLRDLLRKAGPFLQSGMELAVELFQGPPISAAIPEVMRHG